MPCMFAPSPAMHGLPVLLQATVLEFRAVSNNTILYLLALGCCVSACPVRGIPGANSHIQHYIFL